jgi:UMF1 family MFS transporter
MKPSRTAGWLDRLGLHRPELRAWAMYDWANSAIYTTIVTSIFPIYFVTVAAADLPRPAATARLGLATTVAMAIAAVLAPLLGAVADYTAMRKKLLAASVALGVAAAAGLSLVSRGEWRLGAVLFVLTNVAVMVSFVFYESFLPHLASEEEMDRVSSGGYALGYLGGGLLLILNLLWIQKPELFGIPDPISAMRLSFLSAALWWLFFSIPIFRRVPEPPRVIEQNEAVRMNPLRAGFLRVLETLRDLRNYRDAFVLLVAFLLYNDGIQTVIRMSAAYGLEIGIPQNSLIAAYVMIQLVAMPFAFLFGWLAGRVAPKRLLAVALLVYGVLTLFAYNMRTSRDFFVLAFLVATVLGGSQAISRSLFATMIPRYKSAEFFGFWGVFDKFAGIFGPAIFTVMVWTTGSSRNAILALVLFFIAGGGLLVFVDVDRGRRAAREAEARAGLQPA